MNTEEKLKQISDKMSKYRTHTGTSADFCLNCNTSIPENLKKEYEIILLQYIEKHPESILTSESSEEDRTRFQKNVREAQKEN